MHGGLDDVLSQRPGPAPRGATLSEMVAIAADLAAPRHVGRYLVFEPFARGGMASVHLGRYEASPGLARVVAVKCLDRAADVDGTLAARLLEEARLLFRMRHPCVVPMLDVVTDDEHVCLVLDYVHGVSLAALLESTSGTREPLPTPIAVAIAIDVLRGLHAAHEARSPDGAPLGIVHRDVSPQNVLVGLDGVSRILDFGIAKALGRDKLTKTGTTLGKVVYMSPEQLKALPLTAQADQYSMGALLWEALTGRSFADALGSADRQAPAPSSIASRVPAEVDRIVLRALSREARDRFASCEEMAAELEEATPRASALEATRLVERLAGDELERRAEQVSRVERWVEPDVAPALGAVAALAEDAEAEPAAEPITEDDVLTQLGPAPPLSLLEPTVVIPRAEPNKTSRATIVIAAAAAAVFAVGIPWLVSSPSAPTAAPQGELHPPQKTPPAPVIAAPIAPSASVLVERPPPPPLPPETPPPVVIDDLETAPAAARKSGPPLRKIGKPERPASARSASSVKPPVSDSCDPPFSFDADGKKRYKPECLK